ncbi:MAG: NAD(P)-binding protein, partial [Gemmatimonadetes bacterium]|nr:NAD(P)-binding protein [Gemmatimonadota bacterium]
VGGGVSGLGAAWALDHHPDRFDFRLFEANEQIGGNAITADMPQDSGGSIPFDISVTACIPSVYQHILLLMRKFGIELIDTRFSYSVKYHGRVYAHDFDSDLRQTHVLGTLHSLVDTLRKRTSQSYRRAFGFLGSAG